MHVIFLIWLLPSALTLAVLFVGVTTGVHQDGAEIVGWTSRNILPLLGILLSSYFLPSGNPWPKEVGRRRIAGSIMAALATAYFALIAYHFIGLFEEGRRFTETAKVIEPWMVGIQCVAYAAFGPFFGLMAGNESK